MSYSLGLTSIYSGAQANPKNRWVGCNFYDKALLVCNTALPLMWPGYNQAVPIPGLDPAERWDGVTVVANHAVMWGKNRLRWCDADDVTTWIPIGETVSRVRCTLSAGAVQVAPGQLVTLAVNEDPKGIVQDQFIRIDYFTQVSFYQVVSVNSAALTITATLLGLTGASPAGTVFPATTEVNTLPANDAGELINAGDLVNGNILAVVPIGDDAILFKARSIQMLQFVGRSDGTFATRKVITDEGMLGKYSWCRSTDEVIYFLGNRELYAYAGGQDMRPVAVQHTKQLFAEINLAEADRIQLYHREVDNEIWVVYPVQGDTTLPRRVLVYNYRWDTCTIDDYDESQGAITAVGSWDWQNVIPWAQLPDTWENTVGTWEDLNASNALQRLTVMGFQPAAGSPTLNVYGQVYSRAGQPYLAECETQDYDFGDNLAFKYADTVYFALEVLQNLTPRPFKLMIQLGGRDNLDSTIRWSDPQPIEVSGNAVKVSQVNIRRSGRYIRARFYSEQLDVKWKISSLRILARMGATY